MAKTINLDYNGQHYVLEFTRRSIEQMEKSGFNIMDFEGKPMSTLPALFAGAFIANHPKVRRSLTDEIYEHICNKEELMSKLGEMYSEPLEALMAEPEGNEGNAIWGADW